MALELTPESRRLEKIKAIMKLCGSLVKTFHQQLVSLINCIRSYMVRCNFITVRLT